jgi:uncharacterized repeat protein (TIGR01451 family)
MNSARTAWMKSLTRQTAGSIACRSKAGRGSRRRNGGPALLESLENRCLFSGVLGTAAAYAVLGGSTVTNTGATDIVGNVGVSPGSAITGFPPGVISGGTINADDAAAVQAHADLATAYGDIAGEASPAANNLTGQDLGGLTLTPGVYHFSSSATLTGTLTLDAQGDPNARFDIQIGTTLITAGNSAVQVINGALDDNIFFQVGTSATLGTDTAFQGNILAGQSVTLTTGASMGQGRAMAINGAVTLDTNAVSATEADISAAVSTASGPVFAGNTLTYTITVANAGPNSAQAVVLSDLLPTGTTFVSDAQTSGPTFTLTSPAAGGTGTVGGTISALPSGASAVFTVVTRVSPSTVSGASIVNTPSVTTTTIDPNLENNSQTVTTSVATEADLSVTNTTAAGPVVAGNTIAYTITVTNNGPSDAQTVSLSDVLPTHTTFFSDAQTSGPAFTLTSPAAGQTGTVGGTIGTLASGASATFSVVALVSPATASGASIVNTPHAATVTTDPNLANNSQTTTTAVATDADLSVTQTTTEGPVVPGNTVTYTITLDNAGLSDAQTVVLTDLIPAHTTFVSDAQTSGPAFTLSNPAAGATGTAGATIGTLPAGDSATFTLVVLVSPGTVNGASVVNAPNVAAATTDPNSANNTQTATTAVLVPIPTVTSVAPAQGPSSGGATVTIDGTNLENATAVDFGSTPITSFVSDSAGQIVLLSPAGSAGAVVDVTVMTPGRTSAVSAADKFTFVLAPAFTSQAAAAFTVGSPGTFTFTTAGFPTPALTVSTLPAGLTFVDNLNGTATLSGTAPAGTSASYPLTVTAANGISPNATQSFTLTVNPAGTVTPTLTTLTVTAPVNNVDQGRTLQFTAAGTDGSGLPIALGAVTWSLDAGSTGSIDQNGLFTAGATAGPVVVRATSGGHTAIADATVNAIAPAAGTTQVSSVQPVGSGESVTGFVVTFNGPVDPTTAQNVLGYRVMRQSTVRRQRNFWQHLFGKNAGTQTVYTARKIASAVYDPQTDSVTLTLASPMAVKNGVRVVEVMGTGPHAVLDANAKPIDGDANGTAGGNYLDRFAMSVGKSVTYKTAAGETVHLSLAGPGEIVALIPAGTKTPVIDLVDTDSVQSILTGTIRKGRSSVASAVLDELNGTASADVQLGTEFHVNHTNAAAAL